MKDEKIKKLVRKRYGGIAGGECGCGCGPETPCCDGDASTTDGLEAFRAFGYDTDEVKSFFGSDGGAGLSCGNPIGIAGIREGETVLDLGSGMGFDCHLASMTVGEAGRVIGVDMTPEMIEKARAKLEDEGGPRNIEFRLGEIEKLPVEDDSVDVIISNCVINLSPDKRSVFREAYRVLKNGGRIAVSDVIAIRPLPAEIMDDPEMHCSCIAGAVTADELRGLMKEAGFIEIQIRPKGESKHIVDGWAPGRHIGDYIVSAEIKALKP
jgi:arsenite methyltransferase